MSTLLKSAATIGHVFALNANDDDGICAQHIRITELILAIGIAACAGLIIFDAIIFPLVWLWMTGDRYPIFPLMWPGTNVGTLYGVIFAHSTQTFTLTFGLLAVCLVDLLVIIIFANVPMIATLIGQEIQRFQHGLRHKTLTLPMVKQSFAKILWMHERYER